MSERNDKAPPVEEQVEVKEVSLVDGAGALMAMDRAAIDVQIATAKRFPRSVDKALKEALTLATRTKEVAGSMFYALPRGKDDAGRRKIIEGPSTRLAEVMSYSWGNLRAEGDMVTIDREWVTAVGMAIDLERNVAVRIPVKRRITDSKGRRYSEDLIGVTANAAISIALRNAVFKVIPSSYVQEIYQVARKTSLGKGGTIAQKREVALEWFAKIGVKPEQVFEVLGIRGLEDMGEEQLITLRGLMTALHEGEATVEQIFHPSRHSEATRELNEALREGAMPDVTPSEPTGAEPPSPRSGLLLPGATFALQPDEVASEPILLGNLEMREGTTGGKKWTRWTIHAADGSAKWITSDATLAQLAEEFANQGSPVAMVGKQGKYGGMDLVALRPVTEEDDESQEVFGLAPSPAGDEEDIPF